MAEPLSRYGAGERPGVGEAFRKAGRTIRNRGQHNDAGLGRHIPQLENVLHADRLPTVPCSQSDAYLLELWRTEANGRIVREAKAFARDAENGIQTLIVVFVMKQRHGIPTGREAPEAKYAGPCRNGLQKRQPVGPAIGKMARLSRQASVHCTFAITQPFDDDDQLG